MANVLCFSCVNSISCPAKSCIPPSVLSPVSSISFQNPSPHLHPPKPAAGRASSSRFHSLKATDSDQSKSTKINTIVCADCEGNGAILCTQCKGNGVNSVDHFNGQFKAGALCWLCRGKREILCGNCNGAGFMGGFMSTFDE